MKCPFCRRETPDNFVEKHHLTPKCKKGKEVIYLCSDCGDQIHLLFSNKDLERKYNTLESLLSNEKMQKWVKWVSNKKFGICMKKKK